MKSSHKRIIRGADVEGIMFCSPKGQLEKDDSKTEKDGEDLKALEAFWYNKGEKEGQDKGFEEGQKEGEKEGYRKGFQEGHQQGLEEGKELGKSSAMEENLSSIKQEYASALETLQEAAEKISGSRERLLEEGRSDLIHLVILICEKILKKKIRQPESLGEIIENLLKQAKSIAHGEQVQVLLSAEDLDQLEHRLQTLDYDRHNITKLDFISDPSVPQGSCKIESSLGMIHFNIDRELEHLEEVIKEK